MSRKLDELEKGLSGMGVQLLAIESIVCHLLCLCVFKETIKRGSPDYLGAVIMENESLVKMQLSQRLRGCECPNELSDDILAYQRELFEQLRLSIEDDIEQLKAFADSTPAGQ